MLDQHLAKLADLLVELCLREYLSAQGGNEETPFDVSGPSGVRHKTENAPKSNTADKGQPNEVV